MIKLYCELHQIEKTSQYKQENIILTKNDAELKSQLETYESNFKQLHEAIQKSSKVFSKYKNEILKVLLLNHYTILVLAGLIILMQKEQMVKELEKQRNQLFQQKEKKDIQLIQLYDHSKNIQVEINNLTSLCRTLQNQLQPHKQ